MKELDDKYNKVKEFKININNITETLNTFYEIKYKDNIESLLNIKKEIEERMVNYIEKIEIQNKIKDIYEMCPFLGKKIKLKSSIVFTTFYNIKKVNCNIKIKNEEEIFNEVEEDFNKLKFLFKNNWINILDEIIIRHFYKSLKYIDDHKIYDEIKYIRDYFEIKYIDNSYLYQLLNEIKLIKINIIINITII